MTLLQAVPLLKMSKQQSTKHLVTAYALRRLDYIPHQLTLRLCSLADGHLVI